MASDELDTGHLDLTTLALQCQLRVMADTAWIGDTHTRIGRLGSCHNLYTALPRTTETNRTRGSSGAGGAADSGPESGGDARRTRRAGTLGGKLAGRLDLAKVVTQTGTTPWTESEWTLGQGYGPRSRQCPNRHWAQTKVDRSLKSIGLKFGIN